MGTHLGYIFGSSSYSNNSSYIPKSLKTVTITGGESIGDSAFYGCKGLTSISIPSGVTSIDDYAFAYCISLTSITIPSGVTSIGNHAFSWCTGLTRITFGGTKAQWSAIKRHLFWNWGTGNYTVTCTDGTLSKSQS